MRRPLLLAAFLLALDQLTKWFAMTYLPDQERLLLPGWGLTYVENPGIWLNNQLPPIYLTWLQGLSLLFCLLFSFLMALYRRFYRRSLWMDLALGCLLAAAAGNLWLDRFLYGAARDFILTPIAVANLADLLLDTILLCLAAELITYPPARRLLRMGTPRQMARELRFYWRALLYWLRTGRLPGRAWTR